MSDEQQAPGLVEIIAAEINELCLHLSGVSHGAAIEAYGRIRAATIETDANIAEQIRQAMHGGDEPDDANVLISESDTNTSHWVPLRVGRVLVLESKEVPGSIEVKYVRKIGPQSVVHTVRINNEGIQE